MDFNSLVNGAKVVGVILLAVVGIYASAILGGVVIGVLTNVATGTWNGTTGSGDINVSGSMMTSLQGLETSYITQVTTVLNPISTIAALVIVVVLVGIFFGRKLGLMGKGIN